MQANKNITFNPIKHEYTLEGIPILSVTKIMQEEGITDLSKIPQAILDPARKFGVAVHSVTEYWDEQCLDLKTVDAPLIPYLEAWKQFKADYRIEVKEIELVVYSRKWWYAGTLDRIVTANATDLKILLDIKSTTTLSPATAIQTAAYQLAYEEMTGEKISKRWCIQLKKTGTYSIEEHKDPNDKNVFTATRTLNTWKHAHLKNYGGTNGK